MDGLELCKRLKSDIQTSHIPVLLLSAKATLDDKLQGLETGADDYMVKPFEIRELALRVKNMIEQTRLLREKFSNEIKLDPMDVVITPLDEKFLQQAISVVEDNMSNEQFDVKSFRDEMNMTRSTCARKLYALTNQSPVEFIRTIRLKRAASLLKQNFGNVSEVALEVGFSNPSYFTRMFQRSYNISPSDYAKSEAPSAAPSKV
jgi:AraC-like DNA-binding protein